MQTPGQTKTYLLNFESLISTNVSRFVSVTVSQVKHIWYLRQRLHSDCFNALTCDQFLPVCRYYVFGQSTWAPSMRNIQRSYIWFLSDTSSEPDQYYKQHVFLHDLTRIPIGTFEVRNNTESQATPASFATTVLWPWAAINKTRSWPAVKPLRTVPSQWFTRYLDYKHGWLAQKNHLRKCAMRVLLCWKLWRLWGVIASLRRSEKCHYEGLMGLTDNLQVAKKKNRTIIKTQKFNRQLTFVVRFSFTIVVRHPFASGVFDLDSESVKYSCRSMLCPPYLFTSAANILGKTWSSSSDARKLFFFCTVFSL